MQTEVSEILAPLLSYLKNIAPVSIGLQNTLEQSFKKMSVKKNCVLLKEGGVCKYLWFLSDGLLRSYHIIGDKEITSRIMYTNHIVISPGSFFTQTPAVESIEAITDAELATIAYDDLQKIYDEFPEFNYHCRIITEQYFFKQEQRLYMLRKHDAFSKYKYFLENYSDYLHDIPLKHIATFLNIAPETLSRTRSKIRENK